MPLKVFAILTLLLSISYAEPSGRSVYITLPVGVFVSTSVQDDMRRSEPMAGLDVQYYFNDYIGIALNRDFRLNRAKDQHGQHKVGFYTSFSGVGLSLKKSWEKSDIHCNLGVASVFVLIDDGGTYDYGGSMGVYADAGWRMLVAKHAYFGFTGRYIYAGDIEYMEYTYKQRGFSLMGVVGLAF